MMKVFFNEMTHIATDRTPARGIITYKSHTKHDDVAMAFVMLIKNMAKSEEFIGYIRSDGVISSPRRHSKRQDRWFYGNKNNERRFKLI